MTLNELAQLLTVKAKGDTYKATAPNPKAEILQMSLVNNVVTVQVSEPLMLRASLTLPTAWTHWHEPHRSSTARALKCAYSWEGTGQHDFWCRCTYDPEMYAWVQDIPMSCQQYQVDTCQW